MSRAFEAAPPARCPRCGASPREDVQCDECGYAYDAPAAPPAPQPCPCCAGTLALVDRAIDQAGALNLELAALTEEMRQSNQRLAAQVGRKG